MYFGFALDSSKIYLWDTDLLDTDFLLKKNILLSWRCLEDVFVFKTYLESVLKTSSRHVLKTFPRRFQNVLRDVFKKSGRRLGRQKVVTLKTRWMRLQGCHSKSAFPVERGEGVLKKLTKTYSGRKVKPIWTFAL